MLLRSCPFLTVLACLIALPAAADIVPGTVDDDAFDSSCGTVIIDHDTIVDPLNAFTTSGGFEDGHVLMRNGGLGSVSYIDFQTPRPVRIEGVRLFAHNDGASFSFRRAMSHFSLYADLDADGIAETLVIDEAIDPDYEVEPGNNATDPTNLDLALLTAGPVRAQDWRLEVTQGSDVQPFEGARLVELDALGPPCGACASCEEVHATIDGLDIDVEGVRKSFHSQVDAACRALEREQLTTAGNVLCAVLHHADAQDGKHLSPDSAAELRDCVRAFAEANGIELRCEDEA